MSDEETAEEPDKGWAMFVAETLTEPGLHGGFSDLPLSQRYAGADLVNAIDILIDRNFAAELPRIPRMHYNQIAADSGQILRVIDELPYFRIPTLTGLRARFGFNPVIDIADPYTVRAMNLGRPDRLNETTTSRYSDEAADEDPAIEMIDADTARRGFIAMLAASLRDLRLRLFPAPPSGLIEYTVHATLTDYVLDSSPEYLIKWTRFGHEKTSPVTDKLHSGRYLFQGRRDRSLKRDSVPHLVSSERTRTRLAW